MAAPSSSPSPEALTRQFEALTAELAALRQEHDRMVAERDQLQQRVGWLEAQLERFRFGERTPREHVDTRQTQLAFEDFFQDLIGATPRTAPGSASDEPREKKKPAVTPHGRRDLSADLSHLPVQVVELLPHPLPEGAVKAKVPEATSIIAIMGRLTQTVAVFFRNNFTMSEKKRDLPLFLMVQVAQNLRLLRSSPELLRLRGRRSVPHQTCGKLVRRRFFCLWKTCWGYEPA